MVKSFIGGFVVTIIYDAALTLINHLSPEEVAMLIGAAANRLVDAEKDFKPSQRFQSQEEWLAFLDRTMGSLADDPLERPEQLPFETRETLE